MERKGGREADKKGRRRKGKRERKGRRGNKREEGDTVKECKKRNALEQ